MCCLCRRLVDSDAALGPPGFHTTARELQTCTFQSTGVSNTTKIPRKDPRKEGRKNEHCGGAKKKKTRILGLPPFWAPKKHSRKEWCGAVRGRWAKPPFEPPFNPPLLLRPSTKPPSSLHPLSSPFMKGHGQSESKSGKMLVKSEVHGMYQWKPGVKLMSKWPFDMRTHLPLHHREPTRRGQNEGQPRWQKKTRSSK